VVICLERGAGLHMVQLIPLPLIVSCFSKIQIGFTFLVPAHPGSPGQRAVKLVYLPDLSPARKRHLQPLIELFFYNSKFLTYSYPGCPGKEAVKQVHI